MYLPGTTVIANAVSGLALIFAGLLALAFAWLLEPERQPGRWRLVYVLVVVTGVPTVWYHGYGEAFLPRVADIGTNLLLALGLQAAVLGDYYAPGTRRWVVAVSGGLITLFLLWMLWVGPQAYSGFGVRLGPLGGFSVGELLLIANSALVVGLFFARRRCLPARSRPLLYLLTAVFAAGLYFATATNHRVDYVILAHHAVWHLLAAFGFVVLWGLNQSRFAGK